MQTTRNGRCKLLGTENVDYLERKSYSRQGATSANVTLAADHAFPAFRP